MAYTRGIQKVKADALLKLENAEMRYLDASLALDETYLLVRWFAAMTAVEVYAVWERYAEKRLAAALTDQPEEFLAMNQIMTLKRIPVALATLLVRGGTQNYFDFRSCAELKSKGDKLLGKQNNPFGHLTASQIQYLDTLADIRNYIVHQSDRALAAYKKSLQKVYGIKSKPQPDEFLKALDNRKISPARGLPRIYGLIAEVRNAIEKC